MFSTSLRLVLALLLTQSVIARALDTNQQCYLILRSLLKPDEVAESRKAVRNEYENSFSMDCVAVSGQQTRPLAHFTPEHRMNTFVLHCPSNIYALYVPRNPNLGICRQPRLRLKRQITTSEVCTDKYL